MSTERKFYVIQPGDSLSIIAEKEGVSVQSIMELNGLENQDHIQAGQTIEIPRGVVVTELGDG